MCHCVFLCRDFGEKLLPNIPEEIRRQFRIRIIWGNERFNSFPVCFTSLHVQTGFRRMPSSEIRRRVTLARTDVPEERITSISSVFQMLVTAKLVPTSPILYTLHSDTSETAGLYSESHADLPHLIKRTSRMSISF
jgi:hypothetical protein